MQTSNAKSSIWNLWKTPTSSLSSSTAKAIMRTDMISTSVPTRIQQNATFVLDISALGNRADLYADENGVWKMTGCRPKYYTIDRDENGRVHGNRTSSNMPYLRTKTSTKRSIAEKAQQYGPKRALFQVRKEAGGVCGVDSTGTLPRNENQVKYIKKKQQEPGPANKDPLASVMELQKTTFRGFIREIVCNDLPTVMLFTDRQLNNIVKFCCHKRSNQVSELGVDLTFQLGPFYLLVTSYRNTVLQVKGTNRHPSCIGPVMICMTKEESTYLSFIHCLNREIPGLSQHLHATGTDDECALKNALAAGFQHAAPLLCYIHSERNVKAKGRKLGLSSALVERICQDLYRQGSGLIWSSSREQFDARAAVLMKEWETLERSEKGGPPMFAEYFRAHKLEDMQTRMSKYVMKNLGLGDKPYQQNIPDGNNLCFHSLAVAIHRGCVQKVVQAYKGRSLNKITTATAPKNVGAKAPPRKRPLDDVVMESSTQVEDTAPGSHLQAEVLNPTTLLIRKSARPVDPPSSAPLVLKEITGNIRKCAGCLKSITSAVVGYQDADDQRCCFARFEVYHFWNKATNRWQLTTSTRHYHLNPVCTKMSGKESSVNIKASLVVSEGLQQLVRARFDYDLSS
ncbi:unnamed protein product [Porites lobata]|uniref:MULE transposase domain-containing protein n=1 Tax=Porites lobata TaxID=104759 RepID=A0ABN8NY25_9CNID|nr:unnamed protein product [Porites lobata]